MIKTTLSLAGVSILLSLAGMAPAFAAVDAATAEALFDNNECTKCHDVSQAKKGPALKKIAAKYKGKADGQEKAIKNFTSGGQVKTSDGKMVEHKIIDTKDIKEQKNLADWILSQ
jgi:cytochrome c